MSSATSSKRLYVLFVFAWIVVGGEETEVRLLAKNLPADKYMLKVVGCFRKENMPNTTTEQLEALGIEVDKAPYTLSFEDTVSYLARLIRTEKPDVVVSAQGVRDIIEAYRLLAPDERPPLIEHGGLVDEAAFTSKEFTTRYVGVWSQITAAGAKLMPNPEHVLTIPSMVDMGEFDPGEREMVRTELSASQKDTVVGWVGRFDPKKHVHDFVAAAKLVAARRDDVRFVLIGGPDAFFPEYRDNLMADATAALGDSVQFLGDRKDVPRLLSGLDVLCWLSQGEGLPHVIAEAGAASLAVVATRDGGSPEQIDDGVSGLFVPHDSPQAVAAAIEQLADDPALRQRLGAALYHKVQTKYSVATVVRQWETLFAELVGAD